MLEQLIPLISGFLLTTVLGGVLGYYFQNRSWKHQNDSKIMEAELQTALKVFEDVSKVMDKRLYRMRLLYWRLSDNQTNQETLEHYMNLYRDILFEWNDNLNRHLALIQCYFGTDTRQQIDYKVYEQFKAIGASLEEAYLTKKAGNSPTNLSRINSNIETLGSMTYQLNIRMIELIQHRQVGLYYQKKDTKDSAIEVKIPS